MGVEKQQLIFWVEKNGELEKEIRIPKIINTDISFEMMFGFSMPKQNKPNIYSPQEYEVKLKDEQ
jgi:hypothetical protein